MTPQETRRATNMVFNQYLRANEQRLLSVHSLLALLFSKGQVKLNCTGCFLAWRNPDRAFQLERRGHCVPPRKATAEQIAKLSVEDVAAFWKAEFDSLLTEFIKTFPIYSDGTDGKTFHGIEACFRPRYAGQPSSALVIDGLDAESLRRGIESIRINPKSEYAILVSRRDFESLFGSADTASIDGTPVLSDSKISEGVAYGINVKRTWLCTLQKTIAVCNGPTLDLDSGEWYLWIDCYGNFQFDPSQVVKWRTQ